MVELSALATEKPQQPTRPRGLENCRKRTPIRFCAVEILAALMHAPRSIAQLLDQVGGSQTAMRRWVHEFHRSGLIRICGFVDRDGPGPREKIFSLQTKPFALPDAVYESEDFA